MTSTDPIVAYVNAISAELQHGHATEHTYRSALKTLIEVLGQPKIRAINEPRRTACGAPDFLIVDRQVPLGYIETKNIDANLNEIEKSEVHLLCR